MNARIRVLQVLSALMSVAMVAIVIFTSMQSNMFALPQEVINEPWFKTTLVDFYFNIVILSAWVLYRERTWWAGLLWVVAFVVLGSIATAFYVFLQLSGLKSGDNLSKALLKKS